MTESLVVKPVRNEKIIISQKRYISVKLWPPSHNERWGMSRATIEIQEAKKDNEQWIFSNTIRIPCDGAAALISDLISYYIVEGRILNSEFKNNKNNTTATTPIATPVDKNVDQDIESVLLTNIKNKKLSRTRIMALLNEKGLSPDKSILLGLLEKMASEKKISKEKAIHTASGNEYILWGFPA
ncbi:MAG: hypothetical protein ACTSPV_01040 [Candidatus Hodarchaeales archaeon]